ncbi:putative bifunctional diguanylate cyclase/phosphodiesterase [Aureimonas jatrophae]|uniref:Diguanylate cyclase (GGDEF) domain-containing protein n=1 Tax=Aureimonas jatrophae TaxID=1166073 RepID=A0A1H0KWI8_9HYPH|nr:EAL domain-containing protein [Aureimonas jatrophae]MBB3948913.1 diguanylate cyclase (GGDEF)-like protein [Aureimonas jatrophae]SDO60299.1 diguanylate cyclase (GGDEF) domain-containing protein [Aureimonas jatrophae]
MRFIGASAPTVRPAQAVRTGRPPKRGQTRDLDAYRHLVGSLFSSPASIAISNLIGVFVPWFCWHVTGVDVFLWLTALTALTFGARMVTVLRYTRQAHDLDTLARTQAWDREFLAGTTIFAVLVGINCYLALAGTDSVPAHILTIVAGIAFASGFVARNAARPVFVILQIACLAGPMAAGLVAAGHPYYAGIGAFIVFYGLTNVVITFSINRNLVALATAHREANELSLLAKREASKLDSALNAMVQGLAMFDDAGRLEVCNTRHQALYGLGDPDRLPCAFNIFLETTVQNGMLAPATAERIGVLGTEALTTQRPQAGEIETRTGDVLSLSLEPTPEGGVVLTTENITTRKRVAATIERMANTDSLTGLRNRFSFNQALVEACRDADGQPFSLLSLDIDNFKTVNDTLGHGVGDELLLRVAERLRRLVGNEGTIARFGGDEFLILLIEDAGAALVAARRLLDDFRLPFEIDGRILHVTISVGVASWPVHGTVAAEMMSASDMALYAAKSAGRNAAVLFTREMAEGVHSRRTLEENLRLAWRDRRFALHYQPIVELASGRVVACEALMRWPVEGKGFVSPAEFIPLAEQMGLIVPMGAWAIRQACLDAAAWPFDADVAVNVSAIQFRDPDDLVRSVEIALADSGLDPARLELEVTESLLIDDADETLAAMRRLRALGVKLALDDFGTGYASIGYLARYPFTKVKIDRSFAQLVATDDTSRAIIETICALAHRFDLTVVVEGIETCTQADEIARLGAEFAQGYLFAKPLDGAGLQTLLAHPGLCLPLPSAPVTEATVACQNGGGQLETPSL